jgi:hypothetical protein
MSLTIILFILVAVLLIGGLLWAARPIERRAVSADTVLRALSEEHHYSRLSKILQALQPGDTDFLGPRGFTPLRNQIRAERKRIALLYLDELEREYEMLLETSRVVAAMAPELIAMDEAKRFKLNLRFALGCRYLRWKLRLGLEPQNVFGWLSEMSGGMALRLEMATNHIGERAAVTSDYSSILDEGGNGPE